MPKVVPMNIHELDNQNAHTWDVIKFMMAVAYTKQGYF